MSAPEHPGSVRPEVVDDVIATLTEDAEHDLVGFPGAPFHGHDELMGGSRRCCARSSNRRRSTLSSRRRSTLYGASHAELPGR